MENSKQPAYPFEWQHCEDGKVYEFGLTKRELIAAMAMQGLLSANPEGLHGNVPIPVSEEIAKWSVLFADALLNQLENK